MLHVTCYMYRRTQSLNFISSYVILCTTLYNSTKIDIKCLYTQHYTIPQKQMSNADKHRSYWLVQVKSRIIIWYQVTLLYYLFIALCDFCYDFDAMFGSATSQRLEILRYSPSNKIRQLPLLDAIAKEVYWLSECRIQHNKTTKVLNNQQE